VPVLLALSVVFAVPATASAATTASLRVAQAKVNVGGTEEFSYSGTHLPGGAAAALQYVAARKWVTLKSLGAHAAGTAEVKLGRVGTFDFRVIYASGGRTVATSPTVAVSVLPPLVLSLKGITTKVNAGRAPTFRYSLENLPSGVSAVLQRTYGSTFKTIRTLGDTAGASLTQPALPVMGRYAYRIVLIQSGRVVKATGNVLAYAYGTVSFPLVCNYTSCTGTQVVGTHEFAYTGWVEAWLYPQYSSDTIFSSGTSCRSMSVQFAGNGYAQDSGETAYLEFIQEASDPVYAQVAAGTVGTVTVPLDGGPVTFGGSLSGDAGDVFEVLTNVTASCYTPTGAP
jgi:hypothetical protein